MLLPLAVVTGGLVAAGVYLMLRRSVVRLLFGLVLLGHGANLLVFVVGGVTRGVAPWVAPGESAPPPGAADPIPQALVLTALVIGFAVIAFTTVLVERAYRLTGSDDLERLSPGEESR